jgi:hypothetical protein
MSENWAKRQRRTNQLVRISANYLFHQRSVSPEQIYGLCKLTWITNSYLDENAAYIRSTKIPALGNVFDRDYSRYTLEEVASDVSVILKVGGAIELVRSHTGFTNFYKAYRNTAKEWIAENFEAILPLFKSAYGLETDKQGLKLVREIEKLPGLPKANHNQVLMHPEYLLTPAFFALDKRIRFPLINGNDGVKKLLSFLGVDNAPLTEQYQSMIKLFGKGGIVDAADLDQPGRYLSDFVDIPGVAPTKQFLQKKSVAENVLPVKDESDIESLQQARTVVSRRLHNGLTNKFKNYLFDYTLLEGCDKAAQFDVMVKNYNGSRCDLLVEAKSSIEVAHVRMAVGQLYSYWFHLKNGMEKSLDPHLAVLLPCEPDDEIKGLLDWLKIGVLWFTGDALETCSVWLEGLIIEK